MRFILGVSQYKFLQTVWVPADTEYQYQVLTKLKPKHYTMTLKVHFIYLEQVGSPFLKPCSSPDWNQPL